MSEEVIIEDYRRALREYKVKPNKKRAEILVKAERRYRRFRDKWIKRGGIKQIELEINLLLDDAEITGEDALAESACQQGSLF